MAPERKADGAESRLPVPPTQLASYLRPAPPGGDTACEAPGRDTAWSPGSGVCSVDPDATTSLDATAFGDRYTTQAVLGRGGMGEVRLCRDNLIGREIAMKLVRAGRSDHPEV